jgi:hypothetical protein
LTHEWQQQQQAAIGVMVDASCFYTLPSGRIREKFSFQFPFHDKVRFEGSPPKIFHPRFSFSIFVDDKDWPKLYAYFFL